ncbi:MAG TPA: DinB family protein [Chitinophagaceae bacterium]|nr:DinB family protein [Chitinophagaceae bacterium]
MADQQLFIKMALDAWNTYLKRTGDLFNSLSDEQIMQETSPGRNTGTYLLGHLIAVHDRIIELFFLGERLHPELDEAFLKNPDKSGFDMPPVETLKQYWATVHQTLAGYFANMKADDWFARHSSVSPEDFEKEPQRNKLNLLMNRTNHLAYHYGQVIYLKK